MNKLVWLSLTLIAAVILVIVFIPFEAKVDPEKQVSELVNNYLFALEKRNVDLQIEYADDVRYPEKNEQEEKYRAVGKEITETKLETLQEVTRDEYLVKVSYVEDGGKRQEVSLPVVKKERKWKIILGQGASS
jgi:signal recognition particle subunit SEC65